MTQQRLLAAAALLAGSLTGAPALAAEQAQATLVNPQGEQVGVVHLQQTPDGVLLHVDLQGLPPGVHGFHIHQTGACQPDFGAAGGHYNPGGSPHGFLGEAGLHAGDLPNIHVPESGALTVEYFTDRVSMAEGAPATLFDQDGSAIVIHAGADDYTSQPAGEAGDRIACGVIEAAQPRQRRAEAEGAAKPIPFHRLTS